MTKIFYGNQYVESFKCNGRVLSKTKRFFLQLQDSVKRITLALGFVSLIGWSVVIGGKINTNTNTVYAEKEVIKEVGIKFEDIPMLVKICKAESGGKQFKVNGDVVRGVVNPSDIGYCQINEYINNDEARRLGYDIYTEQGNKDYAVYLFLTRGTEPWNSSRNIWCKGCKQFK